MPEKVEILANENRVRIEGLESGLNRIELKLDEINTRVSNELMHRLPVSVTVTISILTATLGATLTAIIILLRK